MGRCHFLMGCVLFREMDPVFFGWERVNPLGYGRGKIKLCSARRYLLVTILTTTNKRTRKERNNWLTELTPCLDTLETHFFHAVSI